VRPGEGSAHVRIRATVPEDAAERHVMEVFARPDRRLLFVGEQADVPVVEVAHKALVRGWDTLRGWVEDNRENLRVRDAVEDWRRAAADAELIPIGGVLLQRARDWLCDPGDVQPDAILEAYVRRSIAAADAATHAVQRRRRMIVAGLVIAATILAGLSATTGLFYLQAEEQRASADRQKELPRQPRHRRPPGPRRPRQRRLAARSLDQPGPGLGDAVEAGPEGGDTAAGRARACTAAGRDRPNAGRPRLTSGLSYYEDLLRRAGGTP
jgi:hypothetical protein